MKTKKIHKLRIYLFNYTKYSKNKLNNSNKSQIQHLKLNLIAKLKKKL